MSDPWSLDSIVAEAEDLAYKEQAEAEAKAKTEAAAKKQAVELEAREAKERAKLEHDATIQAEVDVVLNIETQLYKVAEALQDATGQMRKDLKADLKKMDAIVKKARGELSKEARKSYTQQSQAQEDTVVPEDEEADREAEELAKVEMEQKRLEALAKKKKADEDVAYAAIRKKQSDEMARRKAAEEEQNEKLAKMRAKYNSPDGGLFDEGDPDEGRGKTADSEYTDAGDLVRPQP